MNPDQSCDHKRIVAQGDGVIQSLLNIFQDDLAVPGENSSGSVAGLRIFNNVLTDAEVAALDLRTPSAVPGPLPLFGAAAASAGAAACGSAFPLL